MRPLPNSSPNLCLLRNRSSLTAGSIALVIVASLVLAVSASAQQGSANAPSAEDAPTLASKVRVVNVLATVRDKHGKIVPKLAVSDFTLEEDGKPVTIRYFSKETDLPLKLGLLVDTSMSQREFLDQEKSASKKFFDQLLREKDSAFLIHFDRETELLQDFTSSRSKLEAALDLLHTPSPYEEQNTGSDAPAGDDSPGEGRRGRMHQGGTTLYDAIYLACDELMKKQTGRKAVVVLSDGVDRGSKESLESAIEAAQRADTVVYSVLFKGENPFNERRGGFGFPGGGPMGGGATGWRPATWRKLSTGRACRWQESPGTHFERNWRTLVRGLEKRLTRPDLCHH